MLNLTFAPHAKFVREYADVASIIRGAIDHYREDVEQRAFPSDAESYHLPGARRELQAKPSLAPESLSVAFEL
jgi:3-methyl-2-oxobutanoate hydroxymethyltransferase